MCVEPVVVDFVAAAVVVACVAAVAAAVVVDCVAVVVCVLAPAAVSEPGAAGCVGPSLPAGRSASGDSDAGWPH